METLKQDGIRVRIQEIKKIFKFSNDGVFADAIDLNRSNFYQYMKEEGGRNIGSSLIYRIAVKLGVNESWLASGKGEMFMVEENEQLNKLYDNHDKLVDAHIRLIDMHEKIFQQNQELFKENKELREMNNILVSELIKNKDEADNSK